jgi:hypothetical protein
VLQIALLNQQHTPYYGLVVRAGTGWYRLGTLYNLTQFPTCQPGTYQEGVMQKADARRGFLHVNESQGKVNCPCTTSCPSRSMFAVRQLYATSGGLPCK